MIWYNCFTKDEFGTTIKYARLNKSNIWLPPLCMHPLTKKLNVTITIVTSILFEEFSRKTRVTCILYL